VDRALSCHVLSQYEKIQTISKSVHGKVYRYRRIIEGRREAVVMKSSNKTSIEANGRPFNVHAPGRHEVQCEDPYVEIGALQEALQALQDAGGGCDYLLKMLECFEDEVAYNVITSDCPGGELYAILEKREIDLPVEKTMFQVLTAAAHMHQLNMGHRDISLENILVANDTPQGWKVKLMDFGQAVACRAGDGHPLWYFGHAGKDCYRPPEAFLPVVQGVGGRSRPVQHVTLARPGGPEGAIVQVKHLFGHIQVILPAGSEGEELPHATAGYQVEKFDAFCCGMVMFMLLFGMPLGEEPNAISQAHSFILTNGLGALLASWDIDFFPNCLEGLCQVNPDRRVSVATALKDPWVQQSLR